MPRRAAGLTAMQVKNAGPGRYGDGNGLYLLVKPSGARSWLFRYTPQGGKMREMGLGRAGAAHGEVKLAEARELAGDLIRQVRSGVDPLAKREDEERAAAAEAQAARVRAITFKEVAEKLMDARDVGLTNDKHRLQWRNTMATYVYPVMGDIPVAEIETGHVLAVLEPIWATKTQTAARVRGRIEAVLDYARTLGWRSAENCARWKGHLSNTLAAPSKVAKVEHHPALPWAEAGAFMAKLAERESVSLMALRFLILTAARSGEVLGATWSEIDSDAKVWAIPAERMKAGREHRVPLSDAALAVLAEAKALRLTTDDEAFVFPGFVVGQPLGRVAMTQALHRMKRGDITPHGFRSTFRDWAAERTSYANEVIEMALAHSVSSKVEAAYRRGNLFEKRRHLMDDWATYLSRSEAASDNVLPMRASAA